MRKSEAVYLSCAISLICLTVGVSSLECRKQQESPIERTGRTDAFSQLGRGFWPEEADCLHRDTPKNLGIRKRVVQVHFATTKYHRDQFCGQNFYIPFGAQCFEEPQTQSSSFELSNINDLNEYLLQWVEKEEAITYCEKTNLKDQLIAQVKRAADYGQALLVEEHILYTHHVPAMSFCDADLTSDFKMAVNNLPSTLVSDEDQQAYFEFIRTFGTYVVNQLVLGGQVMKIHDAANYTFSTRSTLDLLADNSAVFIGGNSAIYSNLDIEDQIEAWTYTVPLAPRTLHYGFVSIDNFFTPTFFPEDENIAAKRENIKVSVQAGRHNVCRHRPNNQGPHLMFKLTDGTVYNYTVGQTFQAPQGTYLANIQFLGKSEEFQQLNYLYLQTDNYQYDRWIELGERSSPYIYQDYQLLDQILIDEWLLPVNNSEPIQYIQIEFFTSETQELIFAQFNNENIYSQYEQDNYDDGYYFESGNSEISKIRFDYIACKPELDYSEYDYKIKWSDFSVTFHQFGELALSPQKGLFIVDIVLIGENSVYQYYFQYNQPDGTDYNYYYTSYFRENRFLRYLQISNYYDYYDNLELINISLYSNIHYFNIETVNGDGETISSNYDSYDNESYLYSEQGFQNLRIDIMQLSPP